MIQNNGIMFLIFILFLMGLYFVSKNNVYENFDTSNCPDTLIQKDSKFYLYNSNKPSVEGENPIIFENLDSSVKSKIHREWTEYDESGEELCNIKRTERCPKSRLKLRRLKTTQL